MTGNRAKHTKIVGGGYALTARVRDVGLSIAADDLEESAYEQDHSHLKGQFESDITIDGYFDGTTGDFHSAMKNISDNALVVSVLLGENATPAAGDITFNQSTQQTDYNFDLPKGGIMTANGTLKAKAGNVAEFGELLMDETITAATNGTSINNGASSSNGATVYYHVTGYDVAETIELKTQDSANGTDWSDLDTSTLDGSARGAERREVSGTVEQYVRAVATPTGESFPVTISFVRK